ncbi:MAG: 2-amino-4-hydroxy-6-hydroxymethyldihydropteridine diphosphokinase [Candidatus Nanopelagicales bacterium]
MTHRVALSIGANLGDREAALATAVEAIRALPGLTDVRDSPRYETDPVGGIAQPDFLNAVVIADTTEPPDVMAWSLLTLARDVEQALHRVREVRWGPRTVDVDILAVGGWTSDDPELTVPHPRLAERAFVLVPWADVDPTFDVPGGGATVAELLAALPTPERAAVRRWSGEGERPTPA